MTKGGFLMKARKNRLVLLSICFISLFLLSIVSCEGPQGPQGPSGTFTGWEHVVEAIKDDVFLLGIIPAGEEYAVQIGTGWAISSSQIITNAHVAYGIYNVCRYNEYMATTNKIVAIKNGSFTGGEETYELIECSVHPSYNNFNPFSNDFAIFTIDRMQDSSIPVADDNMIRSLKVGQEIGTLGFPGELTSMDMDEYQPIATFKDGTISAMRPYNQQTTPQSSDANVLMQYNMNTTGGTSGSPVFNSSGFTIAIHNSGIYAYVIDAFNNFIRIGLGDLKFGIRIDEREDVMTMPYQAQVSEFRNEDPSASSSLNPGQYRIDFDWDSRYDFDLWLCFGGTQFIQGYIDPSRAYIYPFCVHHGDDTYYGPEVATILQLTQEVKIYASNWSPSSTSFSISDAECEISASTGTIANITNPPSGDEKFWIIGILSSSGDFTLINELTDEDPLDDTNENTLSALEDFGVSYTDMKILKQSK
jgi:hypothetical protein